MKNRGGKGVSCQKITEKTGKLASVITVAEDDDIMLITNEGTIIRTSVDSINVYSRTATGVIIMRLGEDNLIKKVARLEKQEEIDEQSQIIDKEIENSPEKPLPERVSLDDEDPSEEENGDEE
jgi:DNA gyrase subunit A